MEDYEIIALYFDRSEDAISQTQIKYGKYLKSIACRILQSEEDADECVNDMYIGAWNSIPPERPRDLKYYLAALARNIALNRFDYNTAKMRNSDSVLALDELEGCLPTTDGAFDDAVILKETINRFLASLDKRTRIVFMQRYWYLCSVDEIAKTNQMSVSNVKVSLHRTRNKFKQFLELDE